MSHVSFAQAMDKEPVHIDIRLMGVDLVDEFIYEFGKELPLEGGAKVILGSITGPVGLDDRFKIMMENRIFQLIRANPDLNIKLVYCGICGQFVAKSTPHATYISQGLYQPEILDQLREQGSDRLVMALNFEAEGRELVLRVSIFSLAKDLPIIWAKTYSTSLSARRTLRQDSPLIGLETARRQQQDILEGRDNLEFVTRVLVRIYNSADATVNVIPLPFAEQSFEVALLPKKNFRAGFSLGFMSIKDSMSAFSVGGGVQKLLFAQRPSLVHPDLYWSFGFNYIRMRGPGALPYGIKDLNIAQIIEPESEPKASLVAYRLGLETHVKYRLGFMAFLEYVPNLKNSETIAQDSFLAIPYHNYGFATVIRW
jgi:hypothetical protein